MKLKKFHVVVCAPVGASQSGYQADDEALAKNYAAMVVSANKGGYAVIYEAKEICRLPILPTPLVEWSKAE